MISRTAGGNHTPLELTVEQARSLNADLSGGVTIANDRWDFPPGEGNYYAKNFIAVMFPRPRNISAYFSAAWNLHSYTSFWTGYTISGVLPLEVQVSSDSTNGLDGTWTTVASRAHDDWRFGWQETWRGIKEFDEDGYPFTSEALGGTDTHDLYMPANAPYAADGPGGLGWAPIDHPAAQNVTAVRLLFPVRPPTIEDERPGSDFRYAISILHLYGSYSDTTERLAFATPGGGELTASWGDVAIGETRIRPFRVRNHGAQIARDVNVTNQHTYRGNTNTASWAIWYSLDQKTWFPSLELGDIPAGGLSVLAYARMRPVPGTVGLRFARMHATAQEWS